MACYSIAVVRAEIKTQHVAELLRSPAGLRSLAQIMEKLLRGSAVTVDQPSPTYAILRAYGLTVTLSGDRLLASSTSLARAEVDAIVAKLEEAVKQGGVALAIERTVEGIKARYGKLAVTADARVGTNRMVRVRVPLT